MPGEFSDQGARNALQAVTGQTLTYAAGTYYLALFTTTPTDTAAGTEYTATGYSRQSVTWSTPALNGSNIMETSNSASVTFGPFTAGTGGTVSACGLYTAVTGGTMLVWWTLDTNRTPGTNDSLQFAASALKLTCD